MTEYFIHSGSGAYRKVQEAKPRLPPSIYFLILSIAWFPHFILLLQANNPYRNRAISFMITGTGLLVQHFVAGTIIYLKVYRWRIAPADSSLKKIAIFEAILSGTPIIAGLFSSFGYVLGLFCLYSSSLLTLMRTSAMLCAAMDLAFVLMFFKHVRNKDGFFERFKKSCKAHTRGILNHPHQKQLDPDDIRKFSSEPDLIVHCGLPRGWGRSIRATEYQDTDSKFEATDWNSNCRARQLRGSGADAKSISVFLEPPSACWGNLPATVGGDER